MWKKVDSDLADLIDLVGDKGMRGKYLNKLINKTDDIQHFFDMDDS